MNLVAADMIAAVAACDPLRGGLARFRAASPLDEETSIILFGVGLETLQRIERGEVDPEPDLAERIGHVIGPQPYSSAGASAKADVLPERERFGAPGDGIARGEAALPSPKAWRSAQPDGPTFHRRGGLILMWHGGQKHELTVSEALAMRAALDRALEEEI